MFLFCNNYKILCKIRGGHFFLLIKYRGFDLIHKFKNLIILIKTTPISQHLNNFILQQNEERTNSFA